MDLTFGIVTINSYPELNFEKRALYDHASKHFKEVLLIDPRKVSYYFIRGTEKPIILYQGRNIANLSALHVRSIQKIGISTSILAHALNICGCVLNDPVRRFRSGYGSKLLTTVGQYANNTGSSSFIAFDLESTYQLITTIAHKMLFPIIVKPINGRQGEGIYILPNPQEMKAYTDRFFHLRPRPDIPIFFQTYVPFVKEYRAFVIDRKVLGMVLKVKQKGTVMANAAQGALFLPENNQKVADFLANQLSDGIYGVDVAIDKIGDIHIIEANVAPNWQAFQQATGIDVAAVLVQDALRKIEERNDK